MNVIKRSGQEVPFDKEKIVEAILKAMNYGSGIINEKDAQSVAKEIEKNFRKTNSTPSIKRIEEEVFTKLVEKGHETTAKSYEGYRAIQQFKANHNTSDDSIMTLVQQVNEDVMAENSNKDALLASTQRDLIAGEVSKDITRRLKLPTHIVQAHDEGILHFHDLDYQLQNIHNCTLVDIKGMFDKGTVISKRKIDTPKSFQVACTVMTQIIAQVASAQAGGQSIDIKHLGKYLRVSRDKYTAMMSEIIEDKESLELVVDKLTKKELSSGVQTIQYQINTLMTTQGQSPFVTLFMNMDKNDEYAPEIALIIEEILNQRIEGIPNEKGVFVTPSFPKLVYVLNKDNCLEGGQYDYLTKIAAECSSKRMYPDYISAKEMAKIYEGNVFSPMGCRAFLSPWKNNKDEYKFEGRFNQGVVSLNLPQIGIHANGDDARFWTMLDRRLELCFEALMCKHNHLLGTTADVAPILWQHGAIARLKPRQKIDKLLKGGYSTISLGYVGVYEATKLMTGCSHTENRGLRFANKLMKHLKATVDRWKEETNIGFALYGTPAESLSYRFARIDKEKYGVIEDVTSKDYYTNSYHVPVTEQINAFDKLKHEAKFPSISTGGNISYIEVPNMKDNVEALEQVINFMYHNTVYAEINSKLDYCHECDLEGEMVITDNLKWECPNCGNADPKKMNVVRRTCGYLGDNYWNAGKTAEMKDRFLHL